MEKTESLLDVKFIPNGPIMIEGTVVMTLPDGSVIEKKNPYLCRCGGSNKKPYCDGTHVKIEFKG